MKLIILILSLISLYLNCIASSPKLLSANYYEKTATILGAEQNYVILEMDFDQDLLHLVILKA